MEFIGVIVMAKRNDKAASETLLEMYTPMLQKYAIIEGVLDEDLYQELCCVLLRCIHTFQI